MKLYHATNQEYIKEDILDEGLRPGTNGPDYSEPRLYFGTSIDVVSQFGQFIFEIDFDDEDLEELKDEIIYRSDEVCYLVASNMNILIEKKYITLLS
jgi:hypothetical protein